MLWIRNIKIRDKTHQQTTLSPSALESMNNYERLRDGEEVCWFTNNRILATKSHDIQYRDQSATLIHIFS